GGRGSEDSCTAELRQLNRKRADPTGGSMNQHALTLLQLQNVVDALQSRQPADGKNTGLAQTDSPGHVRDAVRAGSRVFGIEAEAVAVDLIPHLEAVHVGTECDNRARAIATEHGR